MKVVATTRQEQGTGASRRLRRAGKVPGIVYGGTAEPTAISIDHNPLYHSLRVEAFHSSILDLELDGKPQQVLLRDVQWHAFKQQVMHIDFQRVEADQPIHVKVPLHYMNQETAPAVKLSGGMITHVLMEVEVNCLPRDLPEFIEVDLAELRADQTLHVSDIKFPKGVTPVAGSEGAVIVTVTVKGGADTAEEGEEGDAAKK